MKPQKLKEHELHAAMVTDDEERVVGMVDIMDLVRHASKSTSMFHRDIILEELGNLMFMGKVYFQVNTFD